MSEVIPSSQNAPGRTLMDGKGCSDEQPRPDPHTSFPDSTLLRRAHSALAGLLRRNSLAHREHLADFARPPFHEILGG
jgi:hypothetical protein